MGVEGFIWFMGVVENRIDPLKLGRVQVRIFGWHTDNKTEIPSVDLPWAQPIVPSNLPNMMSTPKEGDYVFGFFLDGEGAQFPAYLGAFPGIPENIPPLAKGFSDQRTKEQIDSSPIKPIARKITQDGVSLTNEPQTRYPRQTMEPSTSRMARKQTLDKTMFQFRKDNVTKVDSTDGSTWSEPTPAYNPLYPFNSVLETNSGHLFELDDTPKNERVTLSHRTGTTSEMYPSGTKLDKIVKDNYEIVHGSNFCYVRGKTEVTVENVAKIRIKGHTTIEIDGDFDLRVAGNMNVTVGKDLNVQVDGDYNNKIKGNESRVVNGYSLNNISKEYAVDAARIDLNSGVASGLSIKDLKEPNAYRNPDEADPLPETIKPVTYADNQVEAPIATVTINDQIVPEANTPAPIANTAAGKICDSKQWQISDNGLALIKKFEGFRPAPYQDSVKVWTIGYGTTTAAGVGITVDANTPPITEAQATEYLKQYINKTAIPALKQSVKVCLTQGQVDALCSFIYNLGAGAFRKSTLLKKINEEDYEGAAAEFMSWNKAGGQVLAGLTRRRQAEQSTFLA